MVISAHFRMCIIGIKGKTSFSITSPGAAKLLNMETPSRASPTVPIPYSLLLVFTAPSTKSLLIVSVQAMGLEGIVKI